MKFLTLNTHSWMEKEAEEKFQLLLEDILEKDYDLICFQEINQEITSPEVEVNDLYQALPAAEPIHQDHYVRLLVEKLSEQGKNYYWTWPIIISVMTATMKVWLFCLKHLLKPEKFWFQMWMIQQTIILAVLPWLKL